MGSPTSHKGHGTRSYPHGYIRKAFNYSQSALATSAPLAWAYVGALSVSFMLACWVLQQMHPISRQHWEAFNEQVPSWVFTGQVAAFGGVLLLNLINLMFCSAPVQYNCNVLLVLIHGVAFATDYLLEVNATPVVVSWSGRMFVPLRYIQWMHTTPTMILLMAMMSSTSRSGVLAAVLADLVMVVTGLAATWTAGVTQMVCLALSMAAFMVVMASIVDMFKGALVETAHDPAVHGLMEKLLWLTLLVWTLFPLVWMAAWAGYLTLGTEQLFWGVSDYGAKVVFSSHLWQKNLATVQQRREATQELLSALDRGVLLERLRGLLAAKERLVHALQHELTTPIHGMMALVQELLHNKTQSASSRTRMLLMIRSSAVCLLNTISTALSSSSTPDDKAGQMNGDRLDSQGGHWRVHKVHLWRVAESVVRLTRPLMRDHVRILNCISKDLPPVQGDCARLMQVLMNLVCSSLKYTHSGSIKISASSTHSAAQVVVADTGAGIPPQQLKQALDPFDMIDGHNVPGSQSPELWDVCRAGLGLYLVKQTLGSMGSELSASSELGKGSTFEFDMPLADSDCESESEADADMFSEPASLRGSLDLLAPNEAPMQLRRSVDLSLNPSAQPRSNNSSPRDLHTNAVLRAAAAATGDAAAGSNGSGGGGSTAAAAGGGAVGATLLSGAGGVGSAVGAMDAAAAAGAGLVRKQNHRAVHNGVIQVLSVDDDPVNQLVASTALKIHKWEVVKCMSGAEALDYLLQRCSVLPDLVLLDVMMPTMSGYEVAKRIREVWPSSLLPIIMVSAKTEEDDIVQGLRCGADDYVPKPFKRAELAARIRAHIRARDAFQQQQATEQQWMLQHNLLPLNVQRKLRNGETVIAESHPAATVLWAEVLGGPTAAVGGIAPAAAPGQNPLQEALRRISSQQQLAAAAAAASGDTAAAAAAAGGAVPAPAAAAAEGGGVDGSSGSNELVVSRSGSALGLVGLEAGPLGLGAFPPGLSPAEAVVRLNSLYTTWEELCAQQDVLGVDFSGSTFVAVSGHDDHPNHASLILRAAAAMLSVAAASTQSDGSPLAVRLGIHTGPLTTGLVGSKAVKLVLMGDTVEGARQLAATGRPGAAHISSEVFAALQPPAAAAAAPWTHQRLPGAVSRQQTYLLRTQDSSSSSGGGTAAAAAEGAAGSGKQEASAAQQQDKQQQQQCAAGASDIGESLSAGAAPEGGSSSRSGEAPSVQPNGIQQQHTQPAAAAAAAGDAAAAAGQQSSSTPGEPSPPAAAAAALAVTADAASASAAAPMFPGKGISSSSAMPVGSSSSSKAPLQYQPLLRLQDDDGDDDTGEVTLSCAAQVPAAAGSSSSGPAVTPGSSNAQPAPQQQQWQQFLLLSPNARMGLPFADSPPPSRVSVATAVSSLAVTPAGPQGLVGRSTSSSDSKLPYLAAVTAAADAVAAPAAAAATAATAAMVSCLTGGPNSSSSGGGGRGLYGSATADAASLLALQQAGSALISQLGVERRQLQQQLLERTQQHAAAAAELACVKQQLQQANSTAEQRGTQVEALRQQVSSLMVRAHLADCWQSLATIKREVGLLGTAPLLGLPGSLDLQQQQQLGQLQGLGGATTAAAMLQQTQQLQQLLQMQMLQQQQQQQQVSFPSHHQAIQLGGPTVSHGMGGGAGVVGSVPGGAAVSHGLMLGGVAGAAMQQQHQQHLEQHQQHLEQQQRQWQQQGGVKQPSQQH